jgi:hypothetical protein
MIPTNERISAGDPDARFYKKKNNQNSKLGYQVAFSTDIKEGIVIRVITIPGCDNLSEEVEKLIKNKVVPELTLDGEFSIGELISLAQETEIIINVPMKNIRNQKVYSKSMFKYNKDLDGYSCPNGKLLRRCCKSKTRNQILYRGIKKECGECPLLEKCTNSKMKVRTIERSPYDYAWELHSEHVKSNQYQLAKVLRGIIAEGKFSEANINYSLNIARYVNLKLMHAQAQMTAVVMNLKRFIKSVSKKTYTKNNPVGYQGELIAS